MNALAICHQTRAVPSEIGVFWGLILWNSLSGEFISIPKEVIGMATTCEDKSRFAGSTAITVNVYWPGGSSSQGCFNSLFSAYRASVEFWFTPKRWITVLRTEAALTFEAFGLSCVAVLHSSTLETLLPVIVAPEFGGDPP
jgi:hypothetical protein